MPVFYIIQIADKQFPIGCKISNQTGQQQRLILGLVISIISNYDVTVGPANFDGHMMFDCVPAEGTIGAGNSTKINVNFSPDHASLLFADLAHVYISNKVCTVIYCEKVVCVVYKK